jgi:hypothetical protein
MRGDLFISDSGASTSYPSLDNYATRNELDKFVLKNGDELANFATKQELLPLVTKTELAENDKTDQKYANARTNTRLALSGGTMTGNINMNNKKITNVAHPAEDLEVANKVYVDNSVETRLSTAGGRLSGALDMNGNKITNLANPAVDSDAASKTYVDTGIAARLGTSGGRMSGVLDMGGNRITNIANPTGDSDAVSKKYVQDNFNLTNYATRTDLSDLATKNDLRQLVTKQDLAANDLVDQQYVNSRITTRLPFSGGTMTGAVDMGENKITNVAAPTSDKDCTTKEYVDMALRKEIPFMYVYKFPFVGSDNRNVSYNITVVNLVDEAFRGKAPHHIMVAGVIGMVPQAGTHVDLVASVKVVEIRGNTMSVRIQTDNKKGGSWTTAFDVYLQVIAIPPRRLATPTFRSLAGDEAQTTVDRTPPAGETVYTLTEETMRNLGAV